MCGGEPEPGVRLSIQGKFTGCNHAPGLRRTGTFSGFRPEGRRICPEAGCPVLDGEIGWGGFGPAPPVHIGDAALRHLLGEMSMPAADDSGVLRSCVGDGFDSDLLDAPEKHLCVALREPGETVGPVDPLQQPVQKVPEECDRRVHADKVIKLVTMENQHGSRAAHKCVFIPYVDSEEMRDRVRRSVMVPANPCDGNRVR